MSLYKSGKWECGGIYRIARAGVDEELSLCVSVINHQGHSTGLFMRAKSKPEMVSKDSTDAENYILVAAAPPEAYVAPAVEEKQPEAEEGPRPVGRAAFARVGVVHVPIVQEPAQPSPKPAPIMRRKPGRPARKGR